MIRYFIDQSGNTRQTHRSDNLERWRAMLERAGRDHDAIDAFIIETLEDEITIGKFPITPSYVFSSRNNHWNNPHLKALNEVFGRGSNVPRWYLGSVAYEFFKNDRNRTWDIRKGYLPNTQGASYWPVQEESTR